VGAVGTAAVITPVNQIRFRDSEYSFGSGDQAGPVITRLYERLTSIQTGDYNDHPDWLVEVK
jgi:branched-chain amino acid aminotransferase